VLTGSSLVLLGIWGAIIPFVGPYFGYGVAGPGSVSATSTWAFTYPRLYLEILPGVATLIGGLLLLGSGNRGSATFGSWLAVAGGIWFVVGLQISRVWDAISGGTLAGTPVAQFMGYFLGLGVIITLLAGVAAGRLAVRGVRDVAADEPETPRDERPIRAA
jgi:hypothetical protein